MSDNKPPITLYFRENISTVHMDGSHMVHRFGHAFENRKRESDVGPYVNLKQFMNETERVAEENKASMLKYGWTIEYLCWKAIQELAKEIKGCE